jgi:hypothetical protein
MRQVMRAFPLTVLLVAAAGCGTIGVDGPAPRGSMGDRLFGREGPGNADWCRSQPLPRTVLAGPTGPAGPAGPQGPAGSAGPAGLAGVAGPQGPTGPTGIVGPAGVIGPAGVVGPVGATGPQGVVGVAGAQGPTGGAWTSLDNVQFEFKRADITSKCAEKIAKLVVWMKENRQVAIGLDGHVDDATANDNDPTLSTRRVQAVRGALITAGVASNRIWIGTFGARAPVCRDATDACLALNRRVEVLALAVKP